MDKPHKHHFVPCVYLKYFAKQKDKKNYIIYCINKGQTKIFPTNTRDVAMEYEYNTVKSSKYLPAIPEGDELYYENKYKEIIEDNWDSIVNNFTAHLTMTCNASPLQRETKLQLGKLMIIQLLRTPQARKLTNERGYNSCQKVFKKLTPIINEIGDKKILKSYNKLKREFRYTDDFAKSAHLLATTDEQRIEKLAKILICTRVWFVYKNPNYKVFPFITSDNPVVFYNPISNEYGLGPNGIDNPYTITIFPVTPKYLIITFHKHSPLGLFAHNMQDECHNIGDELVYTMNKHQFIQCTRQIYIPPEYGEQFSVS
jgi:hypothetical protein